jgi:hypothetical protein
MEEAQTPGLRWRVTRAGRTPIWRAAKAAVKAGYPVKSANLAPFAADERMLRKRCQRLQAEMIEWMSGRRERPMNFDGTFASLISIYQCDAESPYHKLKPSSRHPYDVYIRMLTLEIGARRIDACDGRDALGWFKAWSDPTLAGGRPRIAAARMAMIVLKTALSWGKACRLRGCAEFKATIEDLRFQAPAPRQEAPSAGDIVRVREQAHRLGHAPAALAYALQFEGTLRQWDVIGEWIPLDDPRPSALIDGRRKWIGPTWLLVDEQLVLPVTPTKTEESSRARVVVDPPTCPMVMEELGKAPPSPQGAPLIVNPRTGLFPIVRSISASCGAAAPKRPAFRELSGTGTSALGASPKPARRARRRTMSPSSPAMPTSGRQHGSTIGTPWRPLAGSRGRGTSIAAKRRAENIPGTPRRTPRSRSCEINGLGPS